MKSKLAETVQRDFDKLETKVAELRESISTQFIHSFEWDLVGELYKKEKQLNLYKQLFAEMNYEDGNVAEWLSNMIESIKEELLKGRYLGTSTGVMHNLAHTYTKEVKAEMLPTLEWYLERLTDKIK